MTRFIQALIRIYSSDHGLWAANAWAGASGSVRNSGVLEEMRRRLPPIFTISTEAVEFNFDAGETYGKYQEHRITRPRSRAVRPAQPPPLAYTPPPSSQRMYIF